MDWEAARKRETRFLSCEGDAAAVYRFDEEAMTNRSVPLFWAWRVGESPMASGYDLIFTSPIMQGANALDVLNEYRANGLVEYGDVFVVKQSGEVKCWSVEPMFNHLLPGLLKKHLKSAELSTAQAADQIDGTISNTILSPKELTTEDEALFVVDGTTFLHIETCEEYRVYTRDECYVNYYYTLYNKETLWKLDSGSIEVASDIRDDPWQIHQLAARNILECRTALGGSSLEFISTDLVCPLQDASIWVMDRVELMSRGKVPKHSLLNELRQCQQQVAERTQGGGAPSKPRHGQER